MAPLSYPRLSLAPPGEKEEPTAIFGRVFEQKKYPIDRHVEINIVMAAQETGAKHCNALYTRPNVVLALSSARRGGRERGE